MQTTLLRDARGETGGSYLILIGAVALVGLGAFSGLGGAFDTAIGSDTNGGVPVTVMAGMAGEAPAAPPPSTQAGGGGGGGGNVTVVTVEAGTGGGRSSVWGDTNGDGVLSDAEARAAAASLAGGLSDKFESKGGGCSGFSLCHVTNAAKSVARNPVVRGIGNFANNMGLNPVQMLTDPIGYAKGTWNRGWGVGQFVVGTGKGLYTLVENGSELFNPLDPRFARELLTDPKGFLDRRVGVAKEAWRLAPGVANLAWEMSPAGMGYDLLTGGPDKFLADRKKYGEQLWENPMTQSLVEPWKACAGEPSAAAQNACGQVATDIAITILTGGAGKGARGAGLVDDMARVASHGDDVARVVSHTDELADAGNVASKVDEVSEAGTVASKGDELGDATRAGDDTLAAGDNAGATADDLGRGDEFTNCRNGVCRPNAGPSDDAIQTTDEALAPLDEAPEPFSTQDFVFGPPGSEGPVHLNQQRMLDDLRASGVPEWATDKPGVGFTYPDGTKVRLMEPNANAGRRASFTNANDGAISPFTNKPIPNQEVSGMTKAERKAYIRERTHVLQY